jgi:hypothetical protein
MYFRLLFERTKVREGDGFDVHDLVVVACLRVTEYLLFWIEQNSYDAKAMN